jgi:ketosteroid isomerase-like protein
VRFSVVLGLVVAVVAAAPACRRETPEAAIRRVMDDGCDALQARDVSRAVRHLSPEYKDKLSRTGQQMRGLAFWVLRRGPVTVILRETKIEVAGETATVTTVAHCFLGRENIDRLADLVPQGAQRFELTIRFAREGGDWKVRAIDGDWTNPDLAR